MPRNQLADNPCSPGARKPGVRTLELSAHGGASVKLTDGDSTLFDGTLSGGDTEGLHDPQTICPRSLVATGLRSRSPSTASP